VGAERIHDTVSISIGRWSKLSADHEVRCTEEGRCLVIMMSKTLGEAEGLYGMVVNAGSAFGSSFILGHGCSVHSAIR
jgi:hypothetical protein